MSTGSDFTVNNGVKLIVEVGGSFTTGLSGAGSLGGLLNGTTSGNKNITYNGIIDLELYLRATDSGDFAGNIGNLAGGGAVSNLTINSGNSARGVTLSGTANSYSGDTTVLKGILALAHNAVLPDTTTVYIPNSANGTINLDFTDGTDYIAGLVLGGVAQPNGTYDAASHAFYFTGTGSLTVGSKPEGTVFLFK